jgi:hypothetical protein
MLFNATDVDSNVTYKILNQPDSNFYWNQANGLLNVTWTPRNLTAQNLRQVRLSIINVEIRYPLSCKVLSQFMFIQIKSEK